MEIVKRKNIKRTAEEKEKLVLEYQNGNLGFRAFADEKGIAPTQIFRWNKAYSMFGIEGLKPKSSVKKNSIHKLPTPKTSKVSNEIEILKLELLKKDIEIERLKKGYIVKGVGSNKEFISIRDVNSKSSKN